MKKGMLLLTLAVFLLSLLPVIALAANETDMSTVVTYTKDPPPPPSTPDTEPPPATYEISIPTTIQLTPGWSSKIQITSNYMNLSDGQTVCVTLDERTFAEDGRVYLKNSDNEKIEVILIRSDASLNNSTGVSAESVVARFDNSSTDPVEYGVLSTSIPWDDVVVVSPGEYTGTIYFKIGIENE